MTHARYQAGGRAFGKHSLAFGNGSGGGHGPPTCTDMGASEQRWAFAQSRTAERPPLDDLVSCMVHRVGFQDRASSGLSTWIGARRQELAVNGGPARRIFLSYRRDDTRHVAGRLFDRLTDRFGAGNVFMDVDSVEPGLDFGEVVERAVADCEVLVALIGDAWFGAEDEHGRRRIDDPDDLVAIEVKAALDRGIRVIPVLVDGAVAPKRDDLPEALSSLARRNAVRLDHETFGTDIVPLLAVLDQVRREAAQGKDEQPERLTASTAVPAEEQDATTRAGAAKSVSTDESSITFSALKTLMFNSHANCLLEIHSSSIKFIDNDDARHSYELSARDLLGATFTSPWYSRDSILIKLADGQKYYIDLASRALKERVIGEIYKMLGSQ
jgi:TIR domain-containing protein